MPYRLIPATDASLPLGLINGDVNTDGIRLHSVQGGHGILVVVLHGFPENWYAWHKIMRALMLRYRVIALDMRGAGQLEAPPKPEKHSKKL